MKNIGNIAGTMESFLQATIEKKARIEEKRQRQIQELESKESAKLIQLPLWAETKRGTPNSALRGALFAAILGKDRKALKRELISNEENLQIRFSGWQLDQSDLNVWETVLHMARSQNLGHKIRFSAHGFLKTMGKTTGKKDHEWLKDAFSRLTGCCVEITHGDCTYGGNLIEFLRNEREGHYEITINPKIARLYTAGYTAICWEDRKKIGKRPLALWLHGYIASHAKLYPTKISTLHRLSGSANNNMRDFKRYLKNALTLLKKLNLINDFWFEDDLVHIRNIPSESQKRYLAHQNK